MASNPLRGSHGSVRRPLALLGGGALDPRYRQVVMDHPGTVLLTDGELPPPYHTPLVVVTDGGGLGLLQTVAESFPLASPIVLYGGTRPSISARCIQLGASDVICLAETPPDALVDRIHSAHRDSAEWVGHVLERVPLGIALRYANGVYGYRNPFHRHLPASLPEVPTGEVGDLLDFGEVIDPASGRAFLVSHVPLGDSRDAAWLESVEEITGRHTDSARIVRQQETLTAQAQALARANRELSRLNQAKAHFIAVAGHTIRTPLTAITNAVHVLAQGDHPDRGPRALALAHRNLQRLSDVADDLQEFTDLAAGQVDLGNEPVHLAACIEAAVEPYRADAGISVPRIDDAVPSSLPPVTGDTGRITGLMQRLVRHAVERSAATDTISIAVVHGGTVDLSPADLGDVGEFSTIDDPAGRPIDPVDGKGTMHVSGPCLPHDTLPDTPHGWITIRISDHGPAVANELRDGLFSSFGEAHEGLAHSPFQSGLELAVCERITALHGGSITAEFGTTRGLTVTVCLPQLPQWDRHLLALGVHLRELQEQQADPCLLVVETHAPDVVVQRLRASAQAGTSSGRFVVAPGIAGPAEVTGVIAGGPAAVRAIQAALATLASPASLATRDNLEADDTPPIRVGWARPGDTFVFREVLGRARAAVRPMTDMTDTD